MVVNIAGLFKDKDNLNNILVLLGREKQDSLTKAKAEFRTIYVNIYHFYEYVFNNDPNKKITQFGTFKKLRNYSKSKGLIYPRQAAKDEGVRILLHKFF